MGVNREYKLLDMGEFGILVREKIKLGDDERLKIGINF